MKTHYIYFALSLLAFFGIFGIAFKIEYLDLQKINERIEARIKAKIKLEKVKKTKQKKK